ncbi:MAG: TatD family hydrolase [Filifactoraceae bacterium]
MGLFDTHAHLDDERFNDDREVLIENLNKNGVDFVINVGADLKSSLSSVTLAEKHSFIYATVGIHPHDSRLVGDCEIDKLKEIAKNSKVVAIGEIGLDYYYDNSPREIQKEVFKKQIILANELNLPFVVHSRDAVQDTFNIIKNFNSGSKFVLHSYNQSVEMTRLYLDMGGYFSISGPITFKKSCTLREVVKYIPIESLFIETDCPYLTPEPFRGKRNEPMFVKYIAEEVARIKGLSVAEVMKITLNNAKNFFGI